VMTVEPGIYIREEGFAVRLENNVLITQQGPVDLMERIPIEAEEIEMLMRHPVNNGNGPVARLPRNGKRSHTRQVTLRV
jgi:hypothetical protein